jgi:hypothetical protein
VKEQLIGWDRMYEGRLPWESRLFLLYLLVVLAVSLVRSVKLLNSGGPQADESCAGSSVPRLTGRPSGRLRVLQQADNKFFYTWEMCAAKVGFMKRLVLLTLLLSTLVLVYGTTRILTEIMILKSAPIGFVTGSIAEVLVPFALGIFIGALCDV